MSQHSLAEVTALMQLARQLKPVYSLRRESCETLIGLLWVTGKTEEVAKQLKKRPVVPKVLREFEWGQL